MADKFLTEYRGTENEGLQKKTTEKVNKISVWKMKE